MNANEARQALCHQRFVPHVDVDDDVYGKYEISVFKESLPFFCATVWATRREVCNFVEYSLLENPLFSNCEPATIVLTKVGK